MTGLIQSYATFNLVSQLARSLLNNLHSLTSASISLPTTAIEVESSFVLTESFSLEHFSLLLGESEHSQLT